MNIRPERADGIVACALLSLMVFVGSTALAEAQGVKGAIPANAYLSAATGDRWLCDRGYRKADETCAAISVPSHGYLSKRSYGNGWECNKSYNKRMHACTSGNRND